MELYELNRMFDALAPTPEQEQNGLNRLLHEERKVRPMKKLKKLTVVGIAAALMVVSVAAANPEGVQEFFENIASIIHVDQYRKDLVNMDGDTVAVYSIPHPSVENRGGRAILVIDKKDVADITDALNTEGRFTYDTVTEESQLHIVVEGTATEWTASVMIGEPGKEGNHLYTLVSNSDGSGESSSPGYAVPFADNSGENEDVSSENLELVE